MSQDIISLIEEMQEDIFGDNLNNIPKRISALTASLAIFLQQISAVQCQSLNPILLEILQAYENKDFLLVADILEFELRPLLSNVLGGNE